MKKKLLLITLLVALLACAFAVVVSAAEIPEWTEITEVEGMPNKSVFGADGTVGATSRVLMSDGITYPAYYICKNSASLGFNYNDLSTKSGKSYSAIDVVRLEVPKGVTSSPMSVLKTANNYTSLVTVSLPEGFTTLNGYTFYGSSSAPSVLVSVSLPSTLTTMGQSEFLDCTLLEEINIPEGITTIPKEFAKNTTSLKTLALPSTVVTIKEGAFRSSNLSNGIVVPEGCKTIEKYAFKGTSAKRVDILATTLESVSEDCFSESDTITDIYCKSPIISHKMFYACPNIETVILENTVSIGEMAFCNPSNGTTKISTLVLPEGLTHIGANAFIRSALTEVVLPSTLTTVGSKAFQKCLSLEKVVVLGSILGEGMFMDCSSLDELVLTEKFETFGKDALTSVSTASFTTYYTGTDYTNIKTICSTSTRFSQAGVSTYEEYQGENYTRPKTYMLVYDCNVCDVGFDGVHTAAADDGNCETAVMCRICNEQECQPAMEHKSGERLAYADIMKQGEYYYGCTNPGCEVGTKTKANALFIHVGYSAEEDDGYGIVRKFMFDNDAIAKYIELVDSDFEYGMVVAIANSSPLQIGEDGKTEPANTGVVSANFTNGNYTNLQVKIANITEEAKGISIVNTLYVRVDNEFYYANGETMAKTAEGKSYNDFNPQA